MSLSDFVIAFNYFVVIYFLAINGIYLTLYAISFVEVLDYAKREVFSGLTELFTSKYAPPVSILVPAYNEELTISDSIRSLLALRYPQHEVVVTNDGSKDRTLAVLIEEFGLYESDQPIRRQIETAEIRGVYVSPDERLIVVDKENGGRSDALNAGICTAHYPFVLLTDADVVMEEDALLRIARPLVESSGVAGVGGIIRVANGCKIEKGRIVEPRTPKEAVPTFQIIEYMRAFVASRVAWSKLNCLLIISGAFGMFRQRDLIDSGGLDTNTVAEDMDLTTRLHQTLRENDREYRIDFVPDPVAWTEVPDTLRVLHRQRDRWHRGTIEMMFKYRRMLFNPRYGTVGLLAMPYYFLFEFLGPIIELTGYFALVAGLFLGIINWPFALLFLFASIGLGMFLSVTAVFLEEMRLRRYPRWRDLLKLTLFGVLENFGYRQINTYWRVMAIVSFIRKKNDWGDMERKGFGQQEAGEETAREPKDLWDTTTRNTTSSQR